MKKTLIALAAVMSVSLAVKADYLYWQVSDQALTDYATVEAAERLSHQLMQGRLSGETQGWIGKNEMRQHFAERIHA